jgi:hypothetical protein
VVVEPPPVDPSLSLRERYEAHSSKQPCQSCHRLIDPIGFGFEHFDGIGRYRERDGDHAIDASGYIAQSASTGGDFQGAVALSTLLGRSEEVRDCFALQWFRFAYGIEEDVQLACLVRELQTGFTRSGGDLRALMIASTDTLQVRERLAAQGEVAAGTSMDGGSAAPDAASSVDAGVPDAGEPDATDDEPAQTTLGLTHSVTTDSSWPTGHCDTVSVNNTSGAQLSWRLTLTLDGTISNAWNCTPSAQRGDVSFAGAEWNRELAAGASTSFGYCVAR